MLLGLGVCLAAILGALGSLLVPWILSGHHFGSFGVTFGSFGVTFGALGAPLGPPWGTLGPRPLKNNKTITFWDLILGSFWHVFCQLFEGVGNLEK